MYRAGTISFLAGVTCLIQYFSRSTGTVFLLAAVALGGVAIINGALPSSEPPSRAPPSPDATETSSP
jgi:hypothetical protein